MVDIECSPCSEIETHLKLKLTVKDPLKSPVRRKVASTSLIQNFPLQLFMWSG